MREIYNTKVIGSIEQGTIINSCIAENYNGVSVFGIIITPRCDIDNNKVSTVHYLPVIKLDDWIAVDFWLIFSSRAKNEVIGKLYSILERYKLSRTLIKSFSPSQLRETLKDQINKKDDLDKFSKLLSDLEEMSKKFHEIDNLEIKRLIESYNKVSKSVFKELKENKIKEFYLLESWETNSEYYVVLLREIRKLTYSLANKVSRGVYQYEISESDFSNNDIARKPEGDEFVYSTATLKSPHIEHLIQQFFWNFGRIGVENHPEDLESQFHNKAVNLI
ncbi:MAG: hypothetical protein KIS77_09665 [Saprospiraceae bacterium]|nr:hypothetical protein [Saprospiraceae bacterium]